MYRRRVLGATLSEAGSQAHRPQLHGYAAEPAEKAVLCDSSGPAANVKSCTGGGSPSSTRSRCSTVSAKSWRSFGCGASCADQKPGAAKTQRKQVRRMLHRLHRCMARSGVVAFSFSASALQRRVGSFAQLDEVSKFKSRRGADRPSGAGNSLSSTCRLVSSSVRSYLVHLAALLSILLQTVQEVIGESPLRRSLVAAASEDLEEAPLGLFWAINVLILCSLACGVLVVSSFLAQVFCDGTTTEEINMSTLSETAEPLETASGLSRTLRLLARIMVVALVSFTSGMGLRIIHPLQSAMPREGHTAEGAMCFDAASDCSDCSGCSVVPCQL
ncbi:unnamed protein product [Symbiodinium natans]|uniref:Transmembrane protein n=1 Tax=Symbiodinium natans TaxID=878477 RepID=A0A812PE25_9DINO|nr:unnamed protein product [Symbiodinium natans]